MARPRRSAVRPAGAKPAAPAIVAVGASAGGLEAFSELLAALTRDGSSNLTFVFLQHLQPTHPSILAELLQKSTFLRVEDARQGVLPAPGHVYVLPAGKELALQKGRLALSARPSHELSLPIDRFMRSLAEERKSAAIGVVLAGTASDGTLGLEAIKAEGGICFAQSEDSTEFNSMARSAIASGCVDFVLAPADIACELERLGNHPYVSPNAAAEHKPLPLDLGHGGQRAYAAILDLVCRETGMDFSEYRSSTIGRRIARRMALLTLEQPQDYLRYLRAHPHEIAQLGSDILISATRFFRDPEVWAALKNRILSPLVRQRKPSGQPIRLWSVGCASGEEAYSLAMVALECLGGQCGGGAMVQVFGTDMNDTVVRRARIGRYGPDIAADVSAERLQRFFVQSDGEYLVSRTLREACIFARHNVVREAPFSRLDVICCRNVMIYMESALQQRLLPILHYALNSGGTLVLGTAESAGATPRLFKPAHVGRRQKIYTKLGASEPVHFPLGGPRAPAAAPVPQPRAGDAASAAHQRADSLLLEQFAPPGVIVDATLEVLEFRGRTSEFLEPAPGTASLNLFKLARGDLGAYARSAVLQARKQKSPVRVDGIHAGGREIALQVVPLDVEGTPQFLVLFLSPTDSPARAKGRAAAPASRSALRENERLRRNLAASQQLIATLSDEFQAAKQEYQAANEEIASANEELQSTNEELETSKEELQSSNEELNTVNEELRHSNAEQHQLSADLTNLVEVVDIAFVFLDRELRVRRYSVAAERLLRLIPADIGRRLGEIRWPIPSADLDQLAVAVLAKGQPARRPVRDSQGHFYELRVHPRRGPDNKVEGCIVVLAGTQLEQAEDLASSLLTTMGAAVLLDKDGARVAASPNFPELDQHDGWSKALLEQLKTSRQASTEIALDGHKFKLLASRLPLDRGTPRFLVIAEEGR